MKVLNIAASALVGSALSAPIMTTLDPDFLQGLHLTTNPTHYGNPTGGCMDGEQSVQVQGVAGDFCSPKCDPTCPSDVPEGVTATPQCALRTTTGDKYCALICQDDDACGSGSCQKIFGLGLCTYAASEAPAAIMTTAQRHDAIRGLEAERLNKLPGMTWSAGIPIRFQGEPLGAMKNLLGVKPDQMDRIKTKLYEGKITLVEAPNGFVMPESFDSEENWPECKDIIGDIRDQSNCGCCWAFGGASAASDRLCIASKGKVQIPISAQDVCFCASLNGCGGGYLDEAWEHVKRGAVSGGQYNNTGDIGGGFCAKYSLPHCHHHGPQGSDPYPAEGKPGCPPEQSPKCPRTCDGDASSKHTDFRADKFHFKGRIEHYRSEAAIAHAIMTGGPVESAFTVYDDFENYVSGIYQKTSSTPMGGHAIRIVGWGEDNGVKYWKVANSWNPYWGEKGYFRIKRGNDECGIESQAMASAASASWYGGGGQYVLSTL